ARPGASSGAAYARSPEPRRSGVAPRTAAGSQALRDRFEFGGCGQAFASEDGGDPPARRVELAAAHVGVFAARDVLTAAGDGGVFLVGRVLEPAGHGRFFERGDVAASTRDGRERRSDGVFEPGNHSAVARERLFFAEDQVVRARLGVFGRVLVVADHEVALTVDSQRFARSVDDLHVHFREADRGLAADAGGDQRHVRQQRFQLCDLFAAEPASAFALLAFGPLGPFGSLFAFGPRLAFRARFAFRAGFAGGARLAFRSCFAFLAQLRERVVAPAFAVPRGQNGGPFRFRHAQLRTGRGRRAHAEHQQSQQCDGSRRDGGPPAP